jgi:hypothetical protein
MKIQDLLENVDDELIQDWKASRKLCLKKVPDSRLGASALSSCKSQGLRKRNSKVKVTVKGKRKKIGRRKIKGKKYGGSLPDYSA